MVKNFIDLIKFQAEWQDDALLGDRYRAWLDQYMNVLFILSFLSGSTFSAIQLVNSNLFGLRMFTMGLSTRDMRKFNLSRLKNVIVGENVPQLVIQIVYVANQGGLDIIAFLAILSSTVSIAAAVLDFASKRTLINDKNMRESLFSVKVACKQKHFQRKMSYYKHRIGELSPGIAKIIPLDRNAVEV